MEKLGERAAALGNALPPPLSSITATGMPRVRGSRKGGNGEWSPKLKGDRQGEGQVPGQVMLGWERAATRAAPTEIRDWIP